MDKIVQMVVRQMDFSSQGFTELDQFQIINFLKSHFISPNAKQQADLSKNLPNLSWNHPSLLSFENFYSSISHLVNETAHTHDFLYFTAIFIFLDLDVLKDLQSKSRGPK